MRPVIRSSRPDESVADVKAGRGVRDMTPGDSSFAANRDAIFSMIQEFRLDEALGALQSICEIGSEPLAGLWHSLGSAFETSGRLFDAEIAYARAVEVDPSFAKAWNDLGVTFTLQGKDEQAEVAFRKAIGLDGSFRNPQVNLRDIEIRRRRSMAGKSKLKNSAEAEVLADHLHDDPQNGLIWLKLCREQAQEGNHRLAIKSIRKALKFSPHLAEAWFLLIDLYKEEENHKQMANTLRLLQQTRPESVQVWLRMADIYKELNQTAEATECVRRAVQMDPESALCWDAWATRLSEIGDQPGAMDALKHSLSLESVNSQGWTRLGIWRSRCGDFSDARTCFGMACVQDDSNVEAQVWLAKSLDKLGELDMAEKILFGLLEKQPGEARAWNHLGVIFRLRQRMELAEKCFKKALELLPNYPNPWYNLRDIYLQTGEHESAKSAMDSAASISGTRAARFESDG